MMNVGALMNPVLIAESQPAKHVSSCASPCQTDHVFSPLSPSPQEHVLCFEDVGVTSPIDPSELVLDSPWQHLTPYPDWQVDDAFQALTSSRPFAAVTSATAVITPLPGKKNQRGRKRKADWEYELDILDPTMTEQERCRARQRIYERRYRHKKKEEKRRVMERWFMLEMQLSQLITTKVRKAYVKDSTTSIKMEGTSARCANVMQQYYELLYKTQLLREDTAHMRMLSAWGTAFQNKEIKDSYRHVKLQFTRQFAFEW